MSNCNCNCHNKSDDSKELEIVEPICDSEFQKVEETNNEKEQDKTDCCEPKCEPNCDEEESEEESEEDAYRVNVNSYIYVVSLDGYPQFYNKTRDDALRQGFQLLECMPKYLQYEYFTELEDCEGGLRLSRSYRYKWFMINYTQPDYTIEITRIPQVSFV